MVKKYIPKRGDIGYVNLNPTKGFEQKEIRPVIVISNDVFNNHSNMIVVLPITSNVKEFPTHYLLEDTKKIQGSVLCEHVRSIDYNEKKFSKNNWNYNIDNLNFTKFASICCNTKRNTTKKGAGTRPS